MMVTALRCAGSDGAGNLGETSRLCQGHQRQPVAGCGGDGRRAHSFAVPFGGLAVLGG
jgi:hypothetical protein